MSEETKTFLVAAAFTGQLMIGLFLYALSRQMKDVRRRLAKLRKEVEHDRQTRLGAPHAQQLQAEMDKMRAELINREGAEKLVERVNLVAKDVMVLTAQVNNLARQANAIGFKKVASGVIPAPAKED